MTLYIIVIIIAILLYTITSKRKLVLESGKTINLRNVYIFIMSSILVLMLGLRSTSVGRDTYFYSQMFNNLKGQSFYQVINVEVEHGDRKSTRLNSSH